MEKIKDSVKGALSDKARKEQLRKERELHEQEVKEAEENAAKYMVEFGKSWRDYPSREAIAAVEHCMEVAGCNAGHFPELSRRVQVWCILWYCIRPTDRTELQKITNALLDIAENVPIQNTENAL